ncbi:MAG: GIN domain-containing protein [Flavisolibacter sp.]
MTKAIVLFLALVLSTVFNYSFGKGPGETPKNDPSAVELLVINANVTVVLVNNDKARPELVGDKYLADLVTIRQEGHTMIVSSSKKRDLRDAGIVYIPASQLRRIQINSDAHVSSMYSLKVPQLDVVINGACKIAISNTGLVNLIESNDFTFERTTEEYRLPALILMKKQF